MERSVLINCLVCLICFVVFVSLASAEISFSSPSKIYNLGDVIKISIYLTGIDGMLETNLMCDNNEQLFYAEYLSMKETEKQTLAKSFKLGDEEGTCYLSARLDGTEISQSSQFLVSNNIIVNSNLNKLNFLPSEGIDIKGTAIKENGEKVNGNGEVSIGNSPIESFQVKNGAFENTLLLNNLSNLNGYDYELTVNIFDDIKLNSGTSVNQFHILSVPQFLEIKSNNPKAGESLSFQIILEDQNRKEMDGTISFIIDDPNGKVFSKGELTSKGTKIIEIPSNALVGNFIIHAYYSNINSEEIFFIDKNEKVVSSLDKDVLTVKNVGNVPYSNNNFTIEISGKDNFREEISLQLEVGEEKSFKISAPSGEYDLKVNGLVGRAILTGNVVGVEEISHFSFTNPYLIFTFVMAILLASVFVFQKNMKQQVYFLKDSFSKEVGKREETETRLSWEVGKREETETRLHRLEMEKRRLKEMFEKYTDKELISRELQGRLKQGRCRATFLFTDLRGYSALCRKPEMAKMVLDKYFPIITKSVKFYGGAVSQLVGDAVESMFNIAKEQEDHIWQAVKAGLKIKREVENFNRNRGNMVEIKTGIGIDSGEVYLSSIGGDIKRYQPIGNCITIADGLSKQSTNKVLVTRNVYDHVRDKVKANKVENIIVKGKPIEVYEIIGINLSSN